MRIINKQKYYKKKFVYRSTIIKLYIINSQEKKMQADKIMMVSNIN